MYPLFSLLFDLVELYNFILLLLLVMFILSIKWTAVILLYDININILTLYPVS
ncbi:hypothetical protein KN1_09950 [Stygiolobus caldivivus]|uniref:Uncharacterized protein n=1 Tax=Stygiolobus caldivivus TaxID=2824673 RepID=A0A8D5U620_9CREN|nr:hypothetical protein KN1_09950 [Stygiolobus caldivivus]